MTGDAGVLGHLPGRAIAVLGALAICALGGAAGHGAQAHQVRFIAWNGDDAGSGTRTAPCRTLQGGIDRTPSGAELIILDSGDYGDGATIKRSITISAVGPAATLGGPISINNSSAVVLLKGLRLNGAGVAANGITITGATSVHIEACEIQDFGRNGIVASVTANPELFVTNSVVRNNAWDGLLFATGSGGKLVVETISAMACSSGPPTPRSAARSRRATASTASFR